MAAVGGQLAVAATSNAGMNADVDGRTLVIVMRLINADGANSGDSVVSVPYGDDD